MSDSLTPAPAGTPKPIRRTNQLPPSEVALAALATTVAGVWQASELPSLRRSHEGSVSGCYEEPGDSHVMPLPYLR